MTKQENITASIPCTFSVEKLEGRQMLSGQPWGVWPKVIRQDAAVAAYPNITGQGETIAVIDGGVDLNHPLMAGKFIQGWNFLNNNSNSGLTPGAEPHGTGTAGVIAANGYYFGGSYFQGIAPGVKIISLKQHSNTGVRAAMDWVIQNRYRYNIVGISMVDYIDSGPYRSIYSGEMQTLANMGVFIGEPAGNNGAYSPIHNPGLDANLYVASGTTMGDQMPFSAQRGNGVDLLAPSEYVTIPYDTNGRPIETNYAQGTSWAAPQMVGAAALVKQVNSNFTPGQIMQILKDSGKKIYDGISHQTYSRLDLYAAITMAYQRSGQAGHVVPPSAVQTPPPPPPPASPPPPVVFTPSIIQIEAENYDQGGEGHAYHDNEAQNLGGVFRTGEGVDLGATQDAGGGYAVGWAHAGEWINYTINVTKAGTYKLDIRNGGIGNGGNYHVNIDGANKTGSMTVANTNSWQGYQTQTKTGIYLTAGKHTLQLNFETNGQWGYTGNFNWMKLTQTA